MKCWQLSSLPLHFTQLERQQIRNVSQSNGGGKERSVACRVCYPGKASDSPRSPGATACSRLQRELCTRDGGGPPHCCNFDWSVELELQRVKTTGRKMTCNLQGLHRVRFYLEMLRDFYISEECRLHNRITVFSPECEPWSADKCRRTREYVDVKTVSQNSQRTNFPCVHRSIPSFLGRRSLEHSGAAGNRSRSGISVEYRNQEG